MKTEGEPPVNKQEFVSFFFSFHFYNIFYKV